MNKYIIIFFFAIQYSYSQDYRVIYEFSYKLDSLKKDRDNIEMVLDVQKDYSKFYYKRLLKLDSLVKEGAIISYGFPIPQVIKRKRESNTNQNFVKLEDKYYNYQSIDNLLWNITSQTKFSNNYKLQKAECIFGDENG